MEAADVVVVGSGIAGASYAAEAARGGRRALVLEAGAEPGGALATAAHPSGFWIELGAHTLYASYVETIGLLERAGLKDAVVARARPVLRFLDGDRVLPGANLGAVLRRTSLLELARAAPRWPGASARGKSVREHYARILGARNYERVLAPLLSAVPSQSADDLPADLLFQRRAERREGYPRSFTLAGGLRRLADGLLALGGVDVRTGARVERVDGGQRGERFVVRLAGGEEIAADEVALATPARAAAALVGASRPALAGLLERVGEARVHSLGVVLPAARARVAPAAFLIPTRDAFLSVVTRDVVPDPKRRGFTFHFRPGLDAAARRARAAAVLGVPAGELEPALERENVLPSPRVGHAELVIAIDRELEGDRLALTGNYLPGLAIEDCVRRSLAERARVEDLRAG